MNTRTLSLTTAILLALSLAACKQSPPPAAPSTPFPATGASASTDAEPETFLGRKVKEAIDEARTKLRNENLSLNGNMNFSRGSVTIGGDKGTSDTRPRGEITPAGDLLIDGRKIDVTPQQHAMLVQYRGHILEIAEAGMAIGIAGAELGGKALSGVAGAIFGGKQVQQDFEARMKAEGERLEEEGRKLCEKMRPLLAQQQALAASLPAFKPYATMTEKDVDDCAKDGGAVLTSDAGGTIDDAERARIRDEIREEVRAQVREEVRREVQAQTPAQ